ncbi:DeoR family transcriptional regulator [Anaerobacterium chartisolvens]|uniref:DeoR family transcriptional regulator n=1 Tax=Anaerobacterium chartisolvens TaxID=1297424 RepID=A0A369AVU5_9FIRM|nr:DeoR family transcriptional regulator [Anaerobacterium chartisolvens]
MVNERQQQILQILENKGEIQLQQLKIIFPAISMMTLRRDLISLEGDGYLIRTHGGAVSKKKLSGISGEEDAYSRRAAENMEAKMRIAEKACGMVEKGRSVYFDSGSTLMCLAQMIKDDNFSILTSGINISLELVKKSRISVVTLGGLVNRNTLSVSGPNAMDLLGTINIDLAFMSASGFSIDSGFTISNIYECELKRKVVRRAKKVIMLMDSSKINKDLPFTYAGLEDLNMWVCDKPLSAELEEETKKFRIEIV